MKTIILSLFILIASIQSLKAQDMSDSYSFGIGVKIYPGAITAKKSLNDGNYFEAIGAFWNRGFRATGLYEVHSDLMDVSGLRWYYGAGAHLGFYNHYNYNGNILVGVDGVLGLDYKIKNTPLNLSLDWQPSFEFGNGAGFEGWGGFAVRITL